MLQFRISLSGQKKAGKKSPNAPALIAKNIVKKAKRTTDKLEDEAKNGKIVEKTGEASHNQVE